MSLRMAWPHPPELADVVQRARYKDNWRFQLVNGCLVITIHTTDSRTGNPAIISHSFPVQENVAEPDRWLLDRIFDVERHEAMEFFLIDDAAPFFPDHHAQPYTAVRRTVPVKVSRPNPQKPRWLNIGSSFKFEGGVK